MAKGKSSPNMEAALRSDERTYRNLFEQMAEGYALYQIITDAQGRPCDYRFLEVNAAFERILGLDRERVIGKRVLEVFPDMEPHWIAAYGEVALTGKPVHFEQYSKAFDRQFEVSAFTPEPGFLATTFKDITQRKRLESDVKKSQLLLERIFESIHVLLAYMDKEFNFLRVNRAYAEADGRSPEDFLGKNHFELYPNPENEAIFRQTVQTGQTYIVYAKPFEYPAHPERGVSYWDWRLEPVKDETGQVEALLLSLLNVTERTRSEQELRALNEQLQHTLQELRTTQQQVVQSEKLSALGTLAAGVAHELNNPLMGVMAYVDYAQTRISDPEAEAMLRRAGRELERMRDLLKNMLGFARPIEEKLTEVSLARVIETSLALIRADYKVFGITIDVRLPDHLPTVLAKEGHLQQVFVNLMLNARDALEQRPEKRVTITAREEPGWVVVDVADTGRGIPQALQGRIFDPFFSTKPPGKGTGLGLSVSLNILIDLGGSLTFESREGEGTTFTVRLPVAAARA